MTGLDMLAEDESEAAPMQPLRGLKVVDFGQGVAGPYCGMLLGDFGADVIKVEPLRGDWSRSMGTRVSGAESTTYLSVNRNKRSIAIDLSKPEGLTVIGKLLARSDIVVESFRPGVMKRMGFDYATLSQANPRLVYCSITGFGEDGPYARLPAGDSTIQAMGGLMSIVGNEDTSPFRVGNVVSDMLAGMHGFEAVLLALLERGITGRGRRAEINLFQTILAFQAPPMTEYLLTQKLPRRTGNSHPLITPSGILETRDRPVLFTVLGHQWPGFCKFLGMPELVSDPRFESNEARTAHRQSLMEIIQQRFAGYSSDELLAILRQADVMCAPVNAYDDLVNDPQVVHSRIIREYLHPRLGRVPYLANPIQFGASGEMAPAPMLGEHTHSILSEVLGFPASEISVLESAGVIEPCVRAED